MPSHKKKKIPAYEETLLHAYKEALLDDSEGKSRLVRRVAMTM